MVLYIIPVRCLPPNLINPFLPYRALAAICAVVLLTVTWIYIKTLPEAHHRRVRQMHLVGIGAATAWVVVLAIWVWLQSWLFFPECGIGIPLFGMDWLRPVQHFDRAFLPTVVQVTSIATAMLVAVLTFAIAIHLFRRITDTCVEA